MKKKKRLSTDYDQWLMQTFEICVYLAKLTHALYTCVSISQMQGYFTSAGVSLSYQ